MNKGLKVFVCGGSGEVAPEFYEEAYSLGKLIADLGCEYSPRLHIEQ